MVDSNSVQTVLARKPQVTLVVDVLNWAFHGIASNLIREIGTKYDFTVVVSSHLDHNPARTILAAANSDLVHFFWRDPVLEFFETDSRRYLSSLGTNPESYLKRFKERTKITTSIFDHRFQEQPILGRSLRIMSELVDEYSVSSQKLFDFYSSISGAKAPFIVSSDGVDFKKFKPLMGERLARLSDTWRIGWAGNSNWGGEEGDHKGLRTIVKPAIESLQALGYNVELVLADSATNRIPKKDMPSFYNGLDVLICASESEGTPNPVLEAMSCGVAVISTDVGVVREVLGPLQAQFILEGRSKQALVHALLRLFRNEEWLPLLRAENLNRISSWSWREKSQSYDELFRAALRL